MPWMTLVQQAGTTSTVSGPAAFVTYRRLSEELHPAHADVHFFMYSSFGISAMVSNSSKRFTGNREKRSRVYDYSSFRMDKKVSCTVGLTGLNGWNRDTSSPPVSPQQEILQGSLYPLPLSLDSVSCNPWHWIQ